MEDKEKLSAEAFEWLKLHESELIARFANAAELVADAQLITLFMAGSPGAGKTEVSNRLINHFKQRPLRIDADEIRTFCPGYIGSNAHIFQRAATKGVHILFDYALHNNLNLILDGTFAYHDALQNIQRSLDQNRKVEIVFVFQDPVIAWDFTKKREAIEHRSVSKDVFIRSYFKSQENVNLAKARFKGSVELNVIIRGNATQDERSEYNVANLDFLPSNRYTPDDLEKILV